MGTHAGTVEKSTLQSIGLTPDYELVRSEHGYLILNRHDVGAGRIIRENGKWALEEIESLVDYYGGIMVDVGANIGTHTLAYARYASHVYAFEPQIHVYNQLCANLLLNNIANVTTMRCGLSSVSGHMLMKCFDPAQENCPAGASLGRGGGNDLVPVRTLDELGIPHIDFLKIDVELHELQVLKGARETLLRSHPITYVELHSPDLLRDVPAFMRALGYDSRLWCHIDIVGNDYEGKIPFTEGYLFTWPEP